MKARMQKLTLRLDALSLRERVMIFAVAAVVLAFLLKALLLDPLFSRRNAVAGQIKQNQERISAIQIEIQQKIAAQGADPDRLNQERLSQMREQSRQIRQELAGMQQNLVPPARMPVLLEDILKRNGKLRLVSLKSLPLTGLGTPESASAGAPTSTGSPGAPAAKAPEGPIFRHGVEIVVRGNYLDMVRYLAALEAMPWEVYWGKAKFQTENYPSSTLTLTIYTLSLDKTWLNL